MLPASSSNDDADNGHWPARKAREMGITVMPEDGDELHLAAVMCVCVCVHSARVRWHADHLAVSITSQWPSLNVENNVVEGKGEEDCSGHSLATA